VLCDGPARNSAPIVTLSGLRGSLEEYVCVPDLNLLQNTHPPRPARRSRSARRSAHPQSCSKTCSSRRPDPPHSPVSPCSPPHSPTFRRSRIPNTKARHTHRRYTSRQEHNPLQNPRCRPAPPPVRILRPYRLLGSAIPLPLSSGEAQNRLLNHHRRRRLRPSAALTRRTTLAHPSRCLLSR
jgi:hypothetical protein